MQYTRRSIIKSLLAASALSILPFPKVSFAQTPGDKRFVLVILRGGMDGLAAVTPYGDRDYVRVRKGISLPQPTAVDGPLNLDGFFAINRAMQPLHELYVKKELAVVHAVALPIKTRSHFDSQDFLENGSGPSGSLHDGWLNRTIRALGGHGEKAIAINQQVPLVLSGNVPVPSWLPNSSQAQSFNAFLEKVQPLYKGDRVLGKAFQEGMHMRDLATKSLMKEDVMANKNALRPGNFAQVALPAANLLATEGGPRIAVMEVGGWDTHAGQGTTGGSLYANLADLSNGLRTLADGLQAAWKKTVVVVVTEFGRTVAQNGTAGTDHGTGSVAFILGGDVNGGKMHGNWPGLRQLYEGRDLMPANNMHSVFKAVLQDHLQVSTRDLNLTVFPDSVGIKPLRGLMR